MNHVDLICRCCGDIFRSDEGRRHTVVVSTRAEVQPAPPCNWDAENGYCPACWLLGHADWKNEFRNANSEDTAVGMRQPEAHRAPTLAPVAARRRGWPQ